MKWAFLHPSDLTAYIHLPLMGWQPLGRSTKSQTFLSWRNFISSFMVPFHCSYSFLFILRISWYCLGIGTGADSTAIVKWCLIHYELYICPRSSSSLIDTCADCEDLACMEDDSSWIGSIPCWRFLLICTGGKSPYALSDNILGCAVQVDLLCSTGGQNVLCTSHSGW